MSPGFEGLWEPNPRPAMVKVAGWANQLGAPHAETSHSRRMAHLGGVAAAVALLAYLTWRIAFTLPVGGANLAVAWLLVTFEALPLAGLIVKAITLWNIDSPAPAPVSEAPNGLRVAVLIPTFNEPIAVLAPTVAAACALRPAHETWVLDDGDRDWVADMCRAYGARYLTRPTHEHAKAGNLNHALDVMATEEANGVGGIDIIAVLDCDHVPLPSFLVATLGWFVDDKLALVQGPQAFFNHGAFDDDGISGEQGLFFNVLMPARHQAGAGPFWCGSTSLLRVSALRDVGGVATETITEDMHTTLKLIRRGWKTAYHHQTLAVGLAPATPEQYLLQRRRWGMGAMQTLALERLWTAKRWMSWRNFHEYVNGTLWWLEGIATLIAFVVPTVVLFSGAQTSTAKPVVFTAVFTAMFLTRLWGTKRLMRHQIHWPTAFALRIFRVPVGMACLWWLISRRSLQFEVTPKGASHERTRGRTPKVLSALTLVVLGVLGYASAGFFGIVPWRTSDSSTVAAGAWLILAALVLLFGNARIKDSEYATSRRHAYRFPARTSVSIDGVAGELVDVSVGGAAVRFSPEALPSVGLVDVVLPGAPAFKMEMVRNHEPDSAYDLASLQVVSGDWQAISTMSLWLFHTPAGAVPYLEAGIPVIATVLAD